MNEHAVNIAIVETYNRLLFIYPYSLSRSHLSEIPEEEILLSPPIIQFLEVIQEFDYEQQKTFVEFVTRAPRLPTGGLASVNPNSQSHASTGLTTDVAYSPAYMSYLSQASTFFLPYMLST
ncbi:hypothetical protein L1887_34905 [Cichorium endivia]|nr:hypothetical protein L1887_34905 [Cichorium endivia]